MRKYICIGIPMLYGLFWLVFGLNGFLGFFPIPEPSPKGAAFMAALENAGYVMPLVYGTQILCGLFLIARKFLPLALLLLAPVVANILLYDLFLNPGGLPVGLAVAGFFALIFFKKRKAFMPFLQP